MSGDVQVRFCEKLGVKFPRLTRLSDTVRGAEASANIFSLVITAKSNGIDPYEYLKMVFATLPSATTAEDVEKLMPGKFLQTREK